MVRGNSNHNSLFSLSIFHKSLALKWVRSVPSINGAFLSLSPLLFFFFFLLLPAHTEPRNVPDSTSSSTLLRSNLVEFSRVDILLSSRAYLYLAFESSGPFARFANCTGIASAFYALHEKKEGERKGDGHSPSFPIRDGALSLYFGFARLTEDAEDPYPLRPWNPGDGGDG